MKQTVEVASKCLNKHGEELCGDTVKVAVTPSSDATPSTVVVLSDGLGSGVKANILSTLTAQIACSLFEQGAKVEEVMDTLAETLPECQVRKLAYATFAAIKILDGTKAFLVEYDSPPLILIRDGEIVDLAYTERTIHGREVREASFDLHVGDYMVLVSDGYEHAGVGGTYRLGWGWENISIAVKRWCRTGSDAAGLARALESTALRLYDQQPGDDTTVVAMKVRPLVRATVWTGPPADKEHDEQATAQLMESEGLKIICGGTTAQIAARVLDQELKVEWVSPRQRKPGRSGRKQGTPPMARLEGVDLVTEGIVTLGQTLELLHGAETVHDLPRGDDAANRLARILLSADEVQFIVGTAINPHQVADVLRGETMRMFYVRDLVRELERRKKRVIVTTI